MYIVKTGEQEREIKEHGTPKKKKVMGFEPTSLQRQEP